MVCIDTKGSHLIQETAARKLLRVNYPGEGRGSISSSSPLAATTTSWRDATPRAHRLVAADDGRVSAQPFPALPELIEYFANDKLHVA